MLGTIDSGGRVVIPKEVRERLGLRPGSRIDAELYESLPAAVAATEVIGGSTYDAVVGLTAHRFGHQLLSLDLRAERTYRSLGIDYRLLAQ